MTVTLLILASVLGFVHIFAAILVETRIRGSAWNAGPRDHTNPEDVPVIVGRLRRAQANFLETFPFFATLMLICLVSGTEDWRVTTGGWIYLAARAAYLPIYAKGTPGIRSLIWLVSILGNALVGWAAAAG
ncbi:MAPEG family protein [Pseudooceanicola nitratireducens]|uniref:MAPEG family protein n=1 Tax=Pseudooceanicola nitratireducens TaxID=517719 RepID=UPI0035150C60